MSIEWAPRPEAQEVEPGTPPEVQERLVKQGALEVVTTATGAVLYVPQACED